MSLIILLLRNFISFKTVYFPLTTNHRQSETNLRENKIILNLKNFKINYKNPKK